MLKNLKALRLTLSVHHKQSFPSDQSYPLLYSTSCGDSSIKVLQSVIVDREQGEVRIKPFGYHAILIGQVSNIPTMQFFTGIARNTQSKQSYTLLLTECEWEFQNNALWDTY